MKKTIYAALMLTSMSLAANAQEQLANGGFEEWEVVTYTYKPLFGKEKTVEGYEPVMWSSFLDGSGSLKSTAATVVQLYKDSDIRPGTLGQYSAKVVANSVVGVIAQGNLTNGCVSMGSMSPTDANGNYNYINESRNDQAMKFTGRPTYLLVWLKGKCSHNANVAVHLVSKGYYQDPIGNTSKITAKLIGSAVQGIDVINDWVQYAIPFEYVSNETPYYALVTFSTSTTPGQGSSSDYLLVDDVEMYYGTDIPTTISGVESVESSDNAVYNLAGQRISGATKGIVIKNGKKYVVR